MTVLGSQNVTLSMPGGDEGGDLSPDTLPCVRLYTHSAVSGQTSTRLALSNAEQLKHHKAKRDFEETTRPTNLLFSHPLHSFHIQVILSCFEL